MPFNLIKALLEHGAKQLTLVGNTTGGAQQPRMPDIGMLVENGQVTEGDLRLHRGDPSHRHAAVHQILRVRRGRCRTGAAGHAGRADARGRRRHPGVLHARPPSAPNSPQGRETRVINGREYLLEYALPLDYAFIRATRADTFGNLQFHRSQRNFNPVMATAARITIVEVDEDIVPAGSDRSGPGAHARHLRASAGEGAAARPRALWPQRRQERRR